MVCPIEKTNTNNKFAFLRLHRSELNDYRGQLAEREKIIETKELPTGIVVLGPIIQEFLRVPEEASKWLFQR